MIDLHCHILPGLDDGAATIDEALAMARMAVADGITTVVASAHITPGVYHNSPDEIVAAAEAFARRLEDEGIALAIIPGADVRITPEMLESDRFHLCIGQTTPYVLIEFPHELVPPGSERLIARLRHRGLIPIITHPERNRTLQERPERLQALRALGCLAQVTAMSLTGEFGGRAQATVETMLAAGWVDAIATDAHDIRRRPPILSRGVARAAALIGAAAARRLAVDVPGAIVLGAPVPA